MTDLSSIAKITRPRLQKIVLRKRLLGQLDEARRAPLTWVSGPAGCGKTTAVASWVEARKLPCVWYRVDERDSDIATFFYYLSLAAKKAAPRRKGPLPLLTTEYLRAISIFTKRYFERLFERLRPPHVFVLDNYERVPPDSPFHEVIREALSVMPDGIAAVVASRTAPPPSLARLQMYDESRSIGWESLKFDLEETRSLVGSRRRKGLGAEAIAALQRATTGWAAGLVLLTQPSRIGDIAEGELGQSTPEELFDYFATELFAKADPQTRSFLLKTSCLPTISPRAATELTGRKDAGALLAALSRNHFFTDRCTGTSPAYQFHPLFRGFLQARARETYPREELSRLLRRAGELLDESGQVEDAADLYRAAQDWESLARLIIANARAVIAQGRNRTLESWSRSIPPEVLERTPWLRYWLGMCRMPFDLSEGRGHLEKAFASFRQHREWSGGLLAWSGVIYSINLELGDLRKLDPWIAILGELLSEHGDALLSPEVDEQVSAHVFMALSLREPQHPEFEAWKAKALTLLESGVDVSLRMITGFYLISHLVWRGDHAAAARVLRTVHRALPASRGGSPLARIMLTMAQSWFAWLQGSSDGCLAQMREGLAKSKESGVLIWNYLLMIQGVAASLCAGDLTTAGQLLESMGATLDRARGLDRFYYHHESAWRHWLMGDLASAVAQEELAHALAAKVGLAIARAQSSFAMAHLMRARGEREAAQQFLSECRETGISMGSAIIEFMSLLTGAVLAFDVGDEVGGVAQVRRAFAIGREREYVYFSWWHPSLMEPLCIRALEAGIEPEYVRSLVRIYRLVPENPPVHVESWPWPVAIFTLGRFEILKDGKPLPFARKVQKRPLALLKALVAFGAAGASVEQIADLLWPDAEGPHGRKSLEVTLQRLRRLLGDDEAVQLQGGRLAIDRRRCWVDAWAFESSLESASANRERAATAMAQVVAPGARTRLESPHQVPARGAAFGRLILLEQAAGLYGGHFLSADGGPPCVLAARERLRSRFLRAVASLGEHHQSLGQWSQAAAWLEKGLEVDSLAEELYQRLMICLNEQGLRAEAAAVYSRCRAALSRLLGIPPSARTDAIARALLGRTRGEG